MTKYKRDIDLEVEVITPLIKVVPEAAKDIALKVNQYHRKLESYLKTLKSAHEDYIEKIERYAIGDREDVNYITKGFNTFLKDVKE